MKKVCKNCKWWDKNIVENETASKVIGMLKIFCENSDVKDEELIPEFMKDPEMGICDYADFLFFTKETHSCEAWELKVDID